LHLLSQAHDNLEQAREILQGNAWQFYSPGFNALLRAETAYVAARAAFYLAPFCGKSEADSKSQLPPACRGEQSESHVNRARQLLEQAQEDYLYTQLVNGSASPLKNPRYTYLAALLQFYRAKDLVEAERLGREAIEQAGKHQTRYYGPLNTVAWVYARGFEDESEDHERQGKIARRYARKGDSPKYYSVRRSQAIDFAYRALDLTNRGSEQRADALATLAFTLRNFGLAPQGSVAEYKGVLTLYRVMEPLLQRDRPEATEGLRQKLKERCERLFKHTTSAIASIAAQRKESLYELDFYDGRLRQILAIGASQPSRCTLEKSMLSDIQKRAGSGMARPYNNSRDVELDQSLLSASSFGRAIDDARRRGGYTLRSEIGLSLTRALLAADFPQEMVQQRLAAVAIEREQNNSGKPQVNESVHPAYTLARLEVDASFLGEQFEPPSGMTARMVIEGNLIWTALLSKEAYPTRDEYPTLKTPTDLVLLAFDAATESHWNSKIVHSLAVALFKQAIDKNGRVIGDSAARDQALSIVEDVNQRLGTVPYREAINRLKNCLLGSGMNCTVDKLVLP